MKYFSFASVPAGRSKDRYGNYYRSYSGTKHTGDALVFAWTTPEEKPADLREEARRLMQHSTVRGYLGVIAWWREQDDMLVLSGVSGGPDDPDVAKADGATYEYFIEDKAYRYSPYERFGNCQRLEKIAGCIHCDLHGIACIVEAVGAKSENKEPSGGLPVTLTEDDFKNDVTEIDGYRFISPKLTAPLDGEEDSIFIPNIRPVSRIDFSVIEERRAKASETSKKAAASRRFMKDNCDKCVLQRSCKTEHKRYRYCRGRFPARSTIDAEICHRWNQRLKSWKMKAWQFWAVAYETADLRETTYNRCHVVLGGWDYSSTGGFKVNITRSKTYVHVTKQMTYHEARQLFPRLPATRAEFQKHHRFPKQADQALYFEVMECNSGIRGAWGSYKRPVVKGLTDAGSTELWVSTGRYLSSYHSYRFQSYSDIYRYLGREPSVEQLSYR